jgi:hypothetical protein
LANQAKARAVKQRQARVTELATQLRWTDKDRRQSDSCLVQRITEMLADVDGNGPSQSTVRRDLKEIFSNRTV